MYMRVTILVVEVDNKLSDLGKVERCNYVAVGTCA